MVGQILDGLCPQGGEGHHSNPGVHRVPPFGDQAFGHQLFQQHRHPGGADVEFLTDGPCGHRLVGQGEQAQYGAQPGVGGVDGFEAVGGVQGDQL